MNQHASHTGPLRVVVLGSTGSIGRQALDVASRNPDRVNIVGIAAHSSVDAVVAQAEEFGIRHVAMGDPDSARAVASRLSDASVGSGMQAVEALSLLDDVDVVLNALVGAAGLRATVATLSHGRRLALANKESLVVGGELVMALAQGGLMTPVDSEHSAIHQCLVGEDARDVARIWLTASGGPFRGRSRSDLSTVTADEALQHPNWVMGPKITIDSATLMNKGLEAIEAHHLFGVDYDSIRIIVHPQSCIHSMVEFSDGSVKAHLGATDMRIPIQYALSEPRRWQAPIEPVDFARLGHLDFEDPDFETFRCLRLALDAGRAGGTAPAILNAANEIAVEAFLGRRIGLTQIDEVVERTLERVTATALSSIDQVEEVDRTARNSARESVALLSS